MKVVVFREDMYYRCWRTVGLKPLKDRVPEGLVHKVYACGGVRLVRHYCGDNLCVNPRHFKSMSNEKYKAHNNRRDQVINDLCNTSKIHRALASVVYADVIARQLKELSKYQFEDYVKKIWENILKHNELVIVNNYEELLKELVK